MSPRWLRSPGYRELQRLAPLRCELKGNDWKDVGSNDTDDDEVMLSTTSHASRWPALQSAVDVRASESFLRGEGGSANDIDA